jgi:hypothetical protein
MEDRKGPEIGDVSDSTTHPSTAHEVRCAVRFPLTLPVVISASDKEYTALTNNVSAEFC